MQKVALIDIPGLSTAIVNTHTTHLKSLGTQGTCAALNPVLPAVTMPGHASILTGELPAVHGIVANGNYYREHNEVMMWRQSERLVAGERIWEAGKKRNPDFTCFKHFWWPGMASTADLYTNVRPAYHADGRKSPDVYTNRPGLAQTLQARFGQFPLFHFWGPATSIQSTEWLANTATFLIDDMSPTLSLIYLPHLDYTQQTHGPSHPDFLADVAELDRVMEQLLTELKERNIEVIVVGSYHMNEVSRPIDINRCLRSANLLQVIENATGELVDFAESTAFAVADHQVAHVYVNRVERLSEVQQLLTKLPGVAQVLGEEEQREHGLHHPRSGEFVVLAEKDAWFTYYYWLDDAKAPDFARTVAIHAKPGYDPAELLFDDELRFPKLKVAGKVAKKKLGGRYVMDVIGLDPSHIRGSHGLLPASPAEAPALLSSRPKVAPDGEMVPMTAIKQLALDMVFGEKA